MISILQISTSGIFVACIEVGSGTFVHQQLTQSATSSVSDVFEILVAFAIVSFLQIDALCILMTVVEMGVTALIYEWFTESSWFVSGPDILESISTAACVSNHLIDAVGRRMAVILASEALVDDRTRSGRVSLIVGRACALGVAVHKSADFVEMHLALVRSIDAALGRWWGRSRHAQSAGVGRSVRRLVQKLALAAACVSLLKILTDGVSVAVVLSNATLIHQLGATNSSGSVDGIVTFVNEILSASARVRFRGVHAVGVLRAIVIAADALVDSEQTSSSRSIDWVG